MKAAQYFGPLDIRIVDIPKPEPEEHEALVAIEWCGICGSDLHEYLQGMQPYYPATEVSQLN